MKNLLTFLLLFTVSICCAQYDIKGQLKDFENEGILGALIYLENTKQATQSNAGGEFVLSNVPNGQYGLIISYIGYENIVKSISIDNGDLDLGTFQMKSDNVISDIVINGRLEGQARALNTQKSKINITEIVAAEQIERFPDANVGDALKRLSGINVQYDQGEARFANIRGTAPELNSFTINGERVPSAEAEKRFVQLDLIPADMVSSIEVNKVVTPDMDADAIGGSINLVTAKASPQAKLKGTIGSGINILNSNPIYKGKLNYSNRFGNNKLGLILRASVLDKQVRSDNIEAEWDMLEDGSLYTIDFQIRQYQLQRLRQSYSATVDYDFNENHNIYVSGIYNWRNDWENRYRLRFKDIENVDGSYFAEIRRQTKGGVGDNKFRRLEDQRMQGVSLGGNHKISNLNMTWSFTSNKAQEDRPNERYISMRVKDQLLTTSFSNTNLPQVNTVNPIDSDLSNAFGLKEITEEFQYTEEKDMNARLDFELPILRGINASFLKFGFRSRNKDKFRDNSFQEYSPTDEDGFVVDALSNIESQSLSDFSVGDYAIGSFVSEEFLGNINLANGFESEDVLEEFAGNFNAKENIMASYVMYTQSLNNKIDLLAGLRYERTEIEYSGRIFDGESIATTSNQKDDYENLLPGLHLKYKFSNWTNLRLAWSNTIARPNYFDIVPFQEIELDDNRISVGNPSLNATESMNFDLLGEHYFKNLGIVSAGLFYKDLSNVIATNTFNDFEYEGNVYDRFSQPINAGNASITGFEFGLQNRLDFLPGLLSKLSFYANYTYTKSELKNSTIEGRKNEVLPLVGTPKNILNLSLAFDTKKLDVRVSFNSADGFIEEYNDSAFFDRWYDSVQYLDINANYSITDNWEVYFSVNNLLDQPLRYYQGEVDRVMQVEFYGIQSKFGVKFNY